VDRPEADRVSGPVTETRAVLDRGGAVDVVVVGGGQAGLAAGYFLRRAGVSFVVLDAQTGAGGAWRHGWESLRLFSPARYSPLPGWWMPPQPGEPFPTAAHVRGYLADYERRHALPIVRPVQVTAVDLVDGGLEVRSRSARWRAGAVISATGTWRRPHWPHYPGRFAGRQLHTVSYRRPEAFAGQRVLVVGGGNSAAQILAEVSTVATAYSCLQGTCSVLTRAHPRAGAASGVPVGAGTPSCVPSGSPPAHICDRCGGAGRSRRIAGSAQTHCDADTTRVDSS
jgi:cation diffusion facilitator CzcD-associated flavoprotein CzcO